MKGHHLLQLGLFLIFIVIATILLVWQGIGLTPDRYLVVLLIGAFLIHHSKNFIHDFAPFIFIIIAYDFFRGFASSVNSYIHYSEPIILTKWVFDGHIPTVELQRRYYTPGILHWYDYSAAILYLLHFAAPLIFAFILWFYNRKNFREFMLGLVLASYIALLFFIIDPTAPPWLAAKQGYLQPVTKIFDVVLSTFPHTDPPTFYHFIGTNLAAAVPSLHAGYSFLIFLFGVRFFGLWGFLLIPYFFLMWLSIVYMGEHYFVDIVAGCLVALVAFGLSKTLMERYHNLLDNL